MKLVDDGALSLGQKVFGPTGILTDDIYSCYHDSRLSKLTVWNLLNHSGGWTAHYGDPMFMPHSISEQTGWPLPVDTEHIIRFMLGKSMHFTPGTASVYSNFGYAILGEVVTKAAHMPYEDYVRSQILAPLGIYDMRLGFSHATERLKNEVAYYEQDTTYKVRDYAVADSLVRRSYGGSDIHTLGSAGWVASAVDLLKLTMTIDGFDDVPDQLSASSIASMTDPSAPLGPLGWRRIEGDYWYRSGTLAATSAMIGRRPDGICFAVLLNASNSRGPQLATMLAECMNNAINRVGLWTEGDLLSDDARWQAYRKGVK